ncbi:hypothetical protein P691DRAFT_770746 [Macrolepiota fuliginosa MF-IS2]|uniref:F-box domain-containing protein n=1 Tax=Macrolepiota fuliginosa MF-IS2 TaxID=1400762 RepID=A0A9P5XP15_9AGAR|nr:hypothetical protein P691DRAFT_770746 [Macrolepiota fuliginosa MF-IS2]
MEPSMNPVPPALSPSNLLDPQPVAIPQASVPHDLGGDIPADGHHEIQHVACLEDDHNTEKIFTGDQKVEQSPICVIPPEVLGAIFIRVRDACLFTYYRFDWLCITEVCRHWRLVALDCPELWTGICFESLEFASKMLERSKTAGLTLNTLISSSPISKSILEKSMAHLSHIRALDITCHVWNIIQDSVLGPLCSPSPMLEFLRLYSGRSPQLRGPLINGKPLITTQLPLGVLSNAPHLREVEIHKIPIRWEPLLPHTQISSLKLHDITPLPTLLQLTDLLKAIPQLKILSLAYCLPSRIPAEDDMEGFVVHLPLLEELEIKGNLNDCAAYLPLLRYPSHSLVTLKLLGSNDQSDDTQNIFSSIAHQLQYPSTPDTLPFIIRTVCLIRSASDSLDIYLHDAPLRIKNLSFSKQHIFGEDPPPVSISFIGPCAGVFLQSIMRSFFAVFDLSHLYSLALKSKSDLPMVSEASNFRASYGSLPCLEEMRISGSSLSEFFGALRFKDDESAENATVTEDAVQSDTSLAISPASSSMCPALKALFVEDFGFSYSKSPGLTGALRDMLKSRHVQGAPIQKLILRGNKRLRTWQLKLFSKYVDRMEVDKESMNRAKLDTEDDHTTDEYEDRYPYGFPPRRRCWYG